MTSATSESATRLARTCLLSLSLLALGLCAMTVITVAKRVVFPHDFAVWPDDYVLNELVKLRFGTPLYGSYDDANSFIYAPGGVLLHHALLSAFGLDLDIVANRALAQGWLLLAVVLGVRLVPLISEGSSPGRAQAIVGALGAGAALTLAGYSNPVADTIHPATLELLALTLAATVAAQWPRLSPRARLACALITPACAMLAKQTGGSVAFALAGVALLTKVGSPRQRLTWAAACLISPALTFIALQLGTHGGFARWGLLLPLRQPKLWINALYLSASLTALAPMFVLVLVRAERAVEGRQADPHAAWLRAAAIPIAYVPAAILAFLKMGGGAFDFGALAFLGAVLALAQVRTGLSSSATSLGPAFVTLLAGAQLLLWWPARHMPNPTDEAWSSRKCAHIAEALACGERVLVDEGMTCMIKGGIAEAPRDRGFTIMELAWGGLRDAGGTARRLAAEEYDFLALHAIALPGPWSDSAVAAIDQHYTIYKWIPPVAAPDTGDLDLNERARAEGWPALVTILLERKSDKGRHRLEIIGPRQCKPARR